MIKITFDSKKELMKAKNILFDADIICQISDYNILIDWTYFIHSDEILSENKIYYSCYDASILFFKLIENKLYDDIIHLCKNRNQKFFCYGDLENKYLTQTCSIYDYESVKFILSLDPDFCIHYALNSVCCRKGDYYDIVKLLLEYETTKNKIHEMLSKFRNKSIVIEDKLRCEISYCDKKRDEFINNAVKHGNSKIVKLLTDYNYFDLGNIS